MADKGFDIQDLLDPIGVRLNITKSHPAEVFSAVPHKSSVGEYMLFYLPYFCCLARLKH